MSLSRWYTRLFQVAEVCKVFPGYDTRTVFLLSPLNFAFYNAYCMFHNCGSVHIEGYMYGKFSRYAWSLGTRHVDIHSDLLYFCLEDWLIYFLLLF
jgi:hypothetical protein